MTLRSTLLLAMSATGLWAGSANAQFRCGSDEMRHELLARDPHLLEREAAYEEELQQRMAARSESDSVYIVPVVFHILHELGAENISDEQIFDQMQVLNRDYRLLNSDVDQACCGFQDIAADIRIEFRLAQIDPYGNCTNGIDRIQTLRTNSAGDKSKLNPWFRERYLNVWVVNTIGREGTAGYAYYPSAVEGPLSIADGIIILSDYIGRIGTGSEYNSRALTHEIGHWLNLQHVWGDTNGEDGAPLGHMVPECGDDLVGDTPETRGWNVCPAPSQSDDCTPGVFENFQNYMEYSYCSVMFTEGQKSRMRAAITSNIASRKNLWTETNLIATGTEDGHVSQCAPRADFYCYAVTQDQTNVFPLVCTGTEVHFRDNSGVADPTSWQWSFPGGNPSSSTEQNPVVTYGAPYGHFPATLTVSNAYGSSSVTKEDVVIVSPTYADAQVLLQEPFNDLSSTTYWPVLNYEQNVTKWSWNSAAGHNGPGSFRMNGSATVLDPNNVIGDHVGDVDDLATPTLDLTYLNNGTLKFWYAASSMASNTADVTESLKIYSSTDCGVNWQLRKTVDAPEIVTGGTTAAGYMPIAGDWREVSVPIPSVLETDNVRFKFSYTAGRFSNDLFIDDVNIDGTVGIDEVSANNGWLGLMPNPATDQVTVEIDLAGNAKGELSFIDMTGRTVHSMAVSAAKPRMDLDLAELGLSEGVYLVRLSQAKGQRVQRLVVR